MAKPKRTLGEQELLYYGSDGKLNPKFMEDNDTENVNDLEYYKDQSDNPLFMSMKEDLIKLIKDDLKELKADKKTLESIHKKKLLQMEIDKFNNVPTNFKNTWEQYEFVEKVYNNGDILDEEDVLVIKEKQKEIRDDAKREVFKNHLLKDKFILKYSMFCFNHIAQQIFLYPIPIYLIWFLNSDVINESLMYIVFSLFIMDIWFYLGLTIAALILFYPVYFLNHKIFNGIIYPELKRKGCPKHIKNNIRQTISILISFGLFKRIFHRHKD